LWILNNPFSYIVKGIIDELKEEYDIKIIFKGYEIHNNEVAIVSAQTSYSLKNILEKLKVKK
jgi:hypothetical protein